jgi:hypothetical protein
MNIRHAAALALVVWYLMQPPANPNAPLSKWTRIQPPYDSEAQCLRAIADLNTEINKDLSQGFSSTDHNGIAGNMPRPLGVFIPATCISKDELEKETRPAPPLDTVGRQASVRGPLSPADDPPRHRVCWRSPVPKSPIVDNCGTIIENLRGGRPSLYAPDGSDEHSPKHVRSSGSRLNGSRSDNVRELRRVLKRHVASEARPT